MLRDVLEMFFYLMIAVPFLYMTLDVLFDWVRRGYRFYRRHAQPVLTQYLSSMFK